MRYPDFDLKALYQALDEQRSRRGLSWTGAAREISRSLRPGHPISTSTITGIKDRDSAEGDGILQMLIWLDRSPESFIAGFAGAGAERYRLPDPGENKVLRWDTRALHAAVDARRQELGLSWAETALQMETISPSMLAHLSRGGRTSVPAVMRMVVWVGRPAAEFTRGR